jgi:AcrR family transcriptional regulator
MVMRKNKSAALRKPDILESYYQVLIQEGLEGTSISKIAGRIGIHPSLIIHYFKNKENMKLELVELLIEKYESPAMINFDHIEDDEEHFNALISMIFSLQWSRTVDPSVHFGFYYLSLRNEKIRERFRVMFRWLRDYLREKLVYFNAKGVIKVNDEKKAADYIVTLMEGLEIHHQFLADGKPFEAFAQVAQKALVSALKNGEF